MRRVGLVGFGRIAEHGHLPAWESFDDVEVVAVADLSPNRLDRARSLIPAAALYDSPLELLARAELDGIDICSPPNTHVDLIVAACQRGLADIVCEKPLVLSEDEYVRVAQAKQRSASRIVSVNNWMHSDLNRHISGALQQGAIGTVERVELRTGRPDCALGSAGWMPRWRTDLAHAGGGIILDHGWHQIYLLLGWIRAPLERVSALTRTVDRRHHPVEDEALIDLYFPRSEGRIELSWTANGRSNEGVIRGSCGNIMIHDDRVVLDNDSGVYETPFDGKLTESSYHPDWFETMFRRNVIDDGCEEAERNFAQAGVLVSVISAAYRSAQERGTPCRPTFPTRDAVSAALAERAEMTNGSRGGGQTKQPRL